MARTGSMRAAVEKSMTGKHVSFLTRAEPLEYGYRCIQLLGNGCTNIFSRVQFSRFVKGDLCIFARVFNGRTRKHSVVRVVKESHLCKGGPFKGYWKTVVRIVE